MTEIQLKTHNIYKLKVCQKHKVENLQKYKQVKIKFSFSGLIKFTPCRTTYTLEGGNDSVGKVPAMPVEEPGFRSYHPHKIKRAVCVCVKPTESGRPPEFINQPVQMNPLAGGSARDLVSKGWKVLAFITQYQPLVCIWTHICLCVHGCICIQHTHTIEIRTTYIQ